MDLPRDASDITLAREAQQEAQKANRDYERQRSKKDDHDRIEDAVGPKEIGKEASLEKKRAKRENDREFGEARGDDGGGDWEVSLLVNVPSLRVANFNQTCPKGCSKEASGGKEAIIP